MFKKPQVPKEKSNCCFLLSTRNYQLSELSMHHLQSAVASVVQISHR